MAIPLAAAALTALAPSVYQLYQSGRQRRAARNLKKSNFIPSAIKENVARGRRIANSSVSPGYMRAKENMRESVSDVANVAKRTASDSGQVLSAVASAQAVANDNLNNLEVQNDNFRLQGENMLASANNQKAQVEQKNEDQFQNAKAALKGAASQNEFNAITGIASVGVDALTTQPGMGGASTTPGSSNMSFSNSNFASGFSDRPTYSSLNLMSPADRIRAFGTANINEILSRY